MAISLGSTVWTGANNVTSITTSSITTQASGSTFVVGIINDSVQVPTLTDNKGNTWVQAKTATYNGTGSHITLYTCINGTGGAGHTVTAAWTSVAFGGVGFSEFLGVGAGTLDATPAVVTGTAATGLGPSITTTVANELVVNLLGTRSTSPVATDSGSGFTITSKAATTNLIGAMSFAVPVSSGTVSKDTFSWTTSSTFGTLAVSIKPAAGSGLTLGLTGQSATFTPGSLTPSQSLAVTGQTASFTAGTLGSASTIGVTGQSASFTPGTLTPSAALALAAQTATFTAGALGLTSTLGLQSQSATFTQGTITAGGASDLTLALTGSAASFSPGSLTPASTVAVTGQSGAFSPGSLSAQNLTALLGQSSSFAPGTLAPSASFGLLAANASFSQGTISVAGGDVTLSLSGLTASFSTGQMIASGADQPVTITGAGRPRRTIYFVTIDGQRFECRSVQEALILLAKAKDAAKRLAEDKAMWAIDLQGQTSQIVPVPKIEPPKITVSSRELRSAVAETKREIVQIYERELQHAEIRMLLELSKRQNDDDESLILLM